MAEPASHDNPFGAKPRGFASMDAAKRRDIAREGGRAAHEKGTAHEFTATEARAAALKSRLGGCTSHKDTLQG